MDYAHLSDEQLVILLAQKDEQALSLLYDRHARHVVGISMAVLRDQSQAEDVAQDVFVKLWRQPASYDAGRGRFAPWLLSVARHRAIDLLRSQHGDVSFDQPAGEALLFTLADDAAGPDEEAWLAERRRAVRAALVGLPAAQRQVIELAYFGGMTQSQIAGHLHEPLGTIKTRLRLAMHKLRDALAAGGLELELP